MRKIRVKRGELREIRERKADIFVWTTKLFVLLFLCVFLFDSCSKAYKPIGVQKRKNKKCDCSRWSYNEQQPSTPGTGGSGDADLYVFDVV